jgi:hypothetical protein
MRNRLFGTVLLLSGALAISVAPALAQGRGWGQEKHQGKEADHRDHGRDHADHGRDHEDHGRDHGQAFVSERNHGGDHDGYRREDRRYRYWGGDRDREMVVNYYREHPRGLPPGLAKRESLPPGLQRQLRVNGHLPPGLQARVVWFPRDLDERLGPVPYGYRRCWIGGNVMVVNPKTFAILEIVQGISILAH